MEEQTIIWEILFIDCGIDKSVLVEGYSSIIEGNKWRNANPLKKFIQIQYYGKYTTTYTEGCESLSTRIYRG